MRKVIIGVLLIALCVSSCAYHKQTYLKIKGDEVNVPLGPLEGIKGKGLKGWLYRAVSIAFPAKDALKDFKGIKSEDSESADSSTDSIDVQ